jgi:large subunit ribosomal protein L31e
VARNKPAAKKKGLQKADEETKETEEAGEVKDLWEEVEEEMEVPEEAEELPAEEEEVPEEAVEKVEEEVKPEIVDERIYSISLSRAWITPRRKRAPKAVRLVKNFIERHMKVGARAGEEGETGRLVVSNEVNEKIWSRGIAKPPRRVRVRAVRDVEGTVTVYLAEGD